MAIRKLVCRYQCFGQDCYLRLQDSPEIDNMSQTLILLNVCYTLTILFFAGLWRPGNHICFPSLTLGLTLQSRLEYQPVMLEESIWSSRTDDGSWRIKTNQEINEILEGLNIIRFIKKQRLNWLGHVERMTEDNIVQKIKWWKLIPKRPTGRPKTRWEDDVLENIKSINLSIWKKVVQNRDSWKKVVEQARTLHSL